MGLRQGGLMKLKKMIRALASAAMAVSMYAPVYAEENQDFDEFMLDEYREMMESDYMSLHFGLRDYESLGIEKPELTIGTCEWDYDEAIDDLNETKTKLLAFDYDSLSASQQHDYDTVLFYVDKMIELNSYPYYDFWFEPANGLIDNLTTNFTEYVFYEKGDFEDYLTVLGTVPKYVDEALELTKKQAAEGYFLIDRALDSTLDQIDKFVERTDDNPLIIIFDENVDAFNGLSDSEKADYKARNKDIVLNSYIPAYEKAGEVLESLRGSRKYGESVYDLPEGKEYYEVLAQYKSSSGKSVEDLAGDCESFINQCIAELQDLYYKYPNVNEEEMMDEEEPENILSFLQDMLEEYPKGPEVKFTATYLDPAVANENVVAYYMQPPVDYLVDNVIKINGDAVSNTNDMYTTLAHEGFPGHLYQVTWYLSTKPNLLRTNLNMIGYTEGWAMYAQDHTWKYSSLSKPAAEDNRIYENLNYAINAYADLAVNGLGMSADKLESSLTGMGFAAGLGQGLYDFVTENPGTILPYGVGLTRFKMLENTAKETLKNDFDILEFNEVLLTYGDRPFEIVEADLEEYLAKKTGSEEVKPADDKEEVEPADDKKEEKPDVKPDEKPTEPDKKQGNSWLLYGGIAAVIVIAAAVILGRRKKGNSPF